MEDFILCLQSKPTYSFRKQIYTYTYTCITDILDFCDPLSISCDRLFNDLKMIENITTSKLIQALRSVHVIEGPSLVKHKTLLSFELTSILVYTRPLLRSFAILGFLYPS